MEGGALVAETLLARGQSPEVLGRLGDGLAVQPKDDAAEGLIAVLDVQVDLVRDLGTLGGHDGLREEERAQAQKRSGQEKPPDAEHFR